MRCCAVLGVILLILVPASSFAGPNTPVQKKQAVRKEYFIFTTGSQIPVAVNRFRGPIATTPSNEQIIHITDRNRLMGPQFVNVGHPF